MDLSQEELDRHLSMLSRFAGGVSRAPSGTLTLTLILRSARSAPAQALIAAKDELARAGVNAKAILARLEPETELRQLFATLSALAPREPASNLIRWARNPCLHDAHEQAIYGDVLCWSGDAMRRDAERRNVLSLFDDEAPDRVHLARLAFAALWSASTPVPERHLRDGTAPLPSGEYQRLQPDAATVSPLRPRLQVWPLVRH
jgi:hypothetical protein